MLFALLSVFILSLAAFIVGRYRYGPLLLGIALTGLLAYFISLIPVVVREGAVVDHYIWVASLEVSLSFLTDGLSLFFALLITFFGWLILLYASHYMQGEQHQGRFYAYMLFFMGAMLGLVLSANLISLFVFWELTSFSSYLLIGFYFRDAASRKAARQALLVTGTGGLAMLAGFVLMGTVGDSYELPVLLAKGSAFLNHPHLQAICLLLLLGVFTKSAQFPFHFWLPNAMKAPTPVSAYLHSSTMVKAGIYLLFRFHPIFHEVPLWTLTLGIVGAVTLLIGAVEAFRADDLKRILAYTTISALGIFTMMAGIGSAAAMKGALIYLLAHALYKGALFLVSGIMDHQLGTRQLSELRKIPKKMPYTSLATFLACMSMAGMIPLLGFTGKELLYSALVQDAALFPFFLTLLILASAFFVAIALKIYLSLFPLSLKPYLHQKENGETTPWMFLPPLILGLLGLVMALWPNSTIQAISIAALQSMLGPVTDLDLSLWHGFNTVLLLSMFTLLLGWGIYYFRHGGLGKFKIPFENIPSRLYDWSVHQLQWMANMQTLHLQTGSLRRYISIYIVLFVLLTFYYLIFHINEQSSGIFIGQGLTAALTMGWREVFNYRLVLMVLVSTTLMFIFLARSQLVVVAAIGIIGYTIALSYTLFSAPDVAITQFLVETLGLILLILIAPQLPRTGRRRLKVKKRNFAIALGFGLMMMMIALIAMHIEPDAGLKEYFLQNSVSQGKGHNAVNVILVDFRALDTLGEITVLVITLTGIIGLIRAKKNKLI